MARLRICGQRRKFKEGRWKSDWWVLAGAQTHCWFPTLAAAGAAGWRGAPRAGHCKQADACVRKDLPGLCHLLFCLFITSEKTRKLIAADVPNRCFCLTVLRLQQGRAGARSSSSPGERPRRGWVMLGITVFSLSLPPLPAPCAWHGKTCSTPKLNALRSCSPKRSRRRKCPCLLSLATV